MARRARGMTLESFFMGTYLPSAKLRKRSWMTDRSIYIRHIRPHMGSRPVTGISFGEVSGWLELKRAESYAPSTCNRMLAVLRSVFRLALQRGVISGRSPCAGVRPFPVPGGRERFLGREEALRLFRELERQSCREAAPLKLLMLTGARKREILRARWRHIDFERGILTVPVSKSGGPRHILLSGAALGVLRGLRATAASEWIFPSRNPDRPISDIFGFWKALRCRLGLGDVRIHDLRHTFASILVSSGQSLYVVQKLLGHKRPETTIRYAHLNDRPLRRAVEAVSGYLEVGRAGIAGMKRKGKRGRKENSLQH